MTDKTLVEKCALCGTELVETGAPIWEIYCPNKACSREKDAMKAAAARFAKPTYAALEAENARLEHIIRCRDDQLTQETALSSKMTAARLTAERQRDDLAEALREAKLQLEYLDSRQGTGTTPTMIARIDAALYRLDAGKDVVS